MKGFSSLTIDRWYGSSESILFVKIESASGDSIGNIETSIFDAVSCVICL